jgi:type IV secretory pathway VirJ component
MTLLFAMWLAAASCPPAPVVEVPALQQTGRFAILLTGDGGWRPVDRGIAATLTKNGVPVVGFLVSSYYRTARTPEESACTLAELIRKYRELWHKQDVILIGFSRGADVLPFMVNRLPADVRSSVQLVALLGLEPSIRRSRSCAARTCSVSTASGRATRSAALSTRRTLRL